MKRCVSSPARRSHDENGDDDQCGDDYDSGCASGSGRDICALPVSPPRFWRFKDVDGCVFFAQLFRDDCVSEIALTRYQDRTGVECTINKIHLEDFLEPGMAREAPSLALIAVECGNLLASHLGKRLPDYSFRIIVSVEDRTCTMRFHKLRDGETWLDDIAYFAEALFVIDAIPDSTL